MVDLLQGGQWTPFREEEDGPGSLLLRAERRRRKQKRNAKREKEKQKILKKKTKQNKTESLVDPLEVGGRGRSVDQGGPPVEKRCLKKKN